MGFGLSNLFLRRLHILFWPPGVVFVPVAFLLAELFSVVARVIINQSINHSFDKAVRFAGIIFLAYSSSNAHQRSAETELVILTVACRKQIHATNSHCSLSPLYRKNATGQTFLWCPCANSTSFVGVLY